MVRTMTRALFVLFVGVVAWTACSPIRTDEECKKSEECYQKGRCTAEGTQCVATTDADCRASRFCRNVGECSVANGVCIATKDLDCRESIQCKEAKRCIVSAGECVVLNPGYCRNDTSNIRCKTHGECSLDSRNNVCSPRTDSDCSNSDVCRVSGFCSVNDSSGTCSAKTDADCRRSDACALDGRCNIGLQGSSGTCIVKTHDDCIQSKKCKEGEDKICAFDAQGAGKCVNGREYCLAQPACLAEGRCTWDLTSKQCLIKTDDDCKESVLCKLAKRCKFRDGDALGARCVREDDDPCVSTTSCLVEGLCSSSTDNKCAALSNSDCLLSLKCRQEGACIAASGVCAVPSACVKDESLNLEICPCKGAVCTEYGRCSKDGDTCIPTDDKDCAKSERCRTDGLCLKQGSSCSIGGSPQP
ncbi:MAG: hypothetical protein H6727_05850 [Myxococcales bacterium]|nr:hypothetical protein [Myxococcales bacterium]